MVRYPDERKIPVPRGLMKRTLSYRPFMPTRIGRWTDSPFANPSAPSSVVSGVEASSDAERANRMLEALQIYAATSTQDHPRVEIYDVTRRRRTATAVAARRSRASPLLVARPLVFTFSFLATWLRRRGDRRRLLEATNQLCVAPDQILEDLGVSRDQMLAKSMSRPSADEILDETESDLWDRE